MNPHPPVAHPPNKPLVLFDGECGFCRRGIARCQRRTKDRVEYLPFQDKTVATRFPELSTAQLNAAVHLVEPDGRVTRGAEAVFRTLSPSPAWPLWLYQNVPGVRCIAELAYRFVARHRGFIAKMTRPLG